MTETRAGSGSGMQSRYRHVSAPSISATGPKAIQARGEGPSTDCWAAASNKIKEQQVSQTMALSQCPQGLEVAVQQHHGRLFPQLDMDC